MTAAPTEPTDEDLALRAAGRGPSARTDFGLLVRRYVVRLVRYIQCRGVRPDDADEIAADVWLLVWEKLPAWKPDHFRGWLFMIAKRRALDFLRKKVRTVPLDGTGELVDRGESAEDVAVDKEFVTRLKKCHDRLPPDFRSIFDGYSAGESYEALAAAHKLPLGTVQSRLNRARAKLQECVGLTPPAREETDES